MKNKTKDKILKEFEPLFERMSKADSSLNKPAFFKKLSKALDSMRKETEKKRFEEVSKGLEEWARRAKKHKWLKFGDDDWYDEEEVLSSLLGFTGYFKYFNNLKTKNE